MHSILLIWLACEPDPKSQVIVGCWIEIIYTVLNSYSGGRDQFADIRGGVQVLGKLTTHIVAKVVTSGGCHMLTFGEVIRGLVAAIILVIAMFSAVGLSSQAEKFTNPREWKISSGRLDQVQGVVLSLEQMAAICARYQTNEQSAGQIATPNGAESRVGLALSGLKGSPIDLANRPANKSNIMRSAVKLFGRNGTPVFMTGPELRAEAGFLVSSLCGIRIS